MAEQDAPLTPVPVTARDIPPPLTISPAAQRILSAGAAAPRMAWPAPDDADGWRAMATNSEAIWAGLAGPALAAAGADVETVRIGGVPCHDCMPAQGAAAEGPVYLYIHGGAFVVGGGSFAKVLGARAAAGIGVRTISVDYRMPPDHPFPAGPEDCVSVYVALIDRLDQRHVDRDGRSQTDRDRWCFCGWQSRRGGNFDDPRSRPAAPCGGDFAHARSGPHRIRGQFPHQ